MKLSSKNLFNNVNKRAKQNIEESKNFIQRNTKKKISVQNENFKKEIFQKLNEGTILNFIKQSEKRESTKTSLSLTPNNMKYELSMINKYNEDKGKDNNLSFISEFDLEEENNKDSSFNSSDDDNNVEEISIIKKSTERISFDKDKEEYDSKLEKELNDILKLLLNKEKK